MTKQIIVSDTNIIIFLSVGRAFEKFCKEFNVYITKEVEDEIKQGRATSNVKNIFYEQHQKGNLEFAHLNEIQKKFRDQLINGRIKIGKGEASSIAYTYDINNGYFR